VPTRTISPITGSPTLAEPFLPIADDLDLVCKLIEAELASDYAFVNELCQHVERYRGKMIRPALLLLTGSATGTVQPAHHCLAAVVEIVHLATLVHDDVLDESEMRRQQATVNRITGNTAAVLLGDYLISHAYHLCSSLDDQYAARSVARTTNTVCEGELLEIHHRNDESLSEREYLQIVQGKTAALIATSCALGARYAGASEAETACMHDYGIAAGTAFQIVDDVLDLAGDEDQVGKSTGLDLARGSATIPVIHCIHHASAQTAGLLRDAVAGRRDCSRQEVRSWLNETKSIDYAHDVARHYVADALEILQKLPESDARSALLNMTQFILRRKY
jgi:octaprenyl-diphosphate synthase